MSKNFSKGLSLVMTMVVLCLANSITAGATDECPHNNIGNLFSAEENYNCELGGIADFFVGIVEKISKMAMLHQENMLGITIGKKILLARKTAS